MGWWRLGVRRAAAQTRVTSTTEELLSRSHWLRKAVTCGKTSVSTFVPTRMSTCRHKRHRQREPRLRRKALVASSASSPHSRVRSGACARAWAPRGPCACSPTQPAARPPRTPHQQLSETASAARASVMQRRRLALLTSKVWATDFLGTRMSKSAAIISTGTLMFFSSGGSSSSPSAATDSRSVSPALLPIGLCHAHGWLCAHLRRS